jgi:hypothetical protein
MFWHWKLPHLVGTTLTWSGTIHVAPHTLITEWESPGPPLPIGYQVLKAPEGQKNALSCGFHLGLTMLPFVFLLMNF